MAAWNGPGLTISPKSPLSFATTYTVEVGDPAVDTDETPLAAFQASFTTVGIGLHVSALIPAPNVAGVSVQSPIAVIFDGPIDPASVSDAISLTPPVSGSIGVVTSPTTVRPPPSRLNRSRPLLLLVARAKTYWSSRRTRPWPPTRRTRCR